MSIISVIPKIDISVKNLEKIQNSIIEWNYGSKGCWLWKDEHLQIYINGKRSKAPEIIYQIYNGKLDKNSTVIPIVCKDFECVNPEHQSIISKIEKRHPRNSYWRKSKMRNKWKNIIKFIESSPEKKEEYLRRLGDTDRFESVFKENPEQYHLLMNMTAPGREYAKTLQEFSELLKYHPKEEIISYIKQMMNNV